MFYVSFAGPGIGLGLVTAGIDYSTVCRRLEKGIQSVTQQGQHGFDTTVYTQTSTPGGGTGPEAKYDVYDCLLEIRYRL